MLPAQGRAWSRSLPDRGSGIAGVPHDIGHRVMTQSRAPDTEHDGLDDPGPEQEGATDKRDRPEPDCNATGDKQDTGDPEGCRDDPEESRVFDGYFAF